MAVFDDGEHTAHAADNTGLLAVVNVAAADDVASDLLLQPSVILPAADRIPLHLCGTLHMSAVEIHVIFRIQVLAQ